MLNIYKFEPRFPPDTPRCKGLGPTAAKTAAKPDDGELTITPAQSPPPAQP